MFMYYVKKFFGFVRRFALFFLIIIFSVLLIGGIYISVQEVLATKAKDYLVEKYGIKKTDYYSIKTTEYVYSKDMQCESLWFKKCTDDENLDRKVTFKSFKGKEIKVTVNKDGTYEDDYNGTVRQEYIEKLERKNNHGKPVNKDTEEEQKTEDVPQN